MEKALRSLSSKSETAGAIRYALSRWRALTGTEQQIADGLESERMHRRLNAFAHRFAPIQRFAAPVGYLGPTVLMSIS